MTTHKLRRIPTTTHKAKTVTRLVGQVAAGDGITVVKAGGVFTVSADAGAGIFQLSDSDLTALANNSTNGLWARTASGVGAARTLQAPAAGLTITNPAGTAGDPTFALANDLAAVEGLASTGIARRTGTDTWSVGTTVALAEGGTGGTTALTAQAGLGIRANRTSATTYYVRTSTAANSGNDSNTGLTNDAAGAFLTIQAAVNAWVRNTDARGQTSQIVVTGNSTENVVIAGPAVGVLGAIAIIGDTTTPANCTMNPSSGICWTISGGAQVSITGFHHAVASAGAAFSCTFGAQLYIGVATYGVFGGGGGCISCTDYGNVWITGNQTLNGNIGYFIHQPGPGQVYALAITISIPSAIVIGTYFVGLATLAACYLGNATISGAGFAGTTGRRGTTHYSSVLDHGGKATTFLPGDLAVQAIEDGTWRYSSSTVSGFDILQANTINGNTWTAGTGVLTIAAGKTLDIQNTMQFASNDGITVVYGAGGTVLYSGGSPSLNTITLTGGQIAFPASQSASANANTLDDYEEGTWTPVLTYATPGDVAVTYGLQVGVYNKVGRLVTVHVIVATTAHTFTTASGALRITGLPFTSANTAGLITYCAGLWDGINTAAGYTQVTTRIGSNTTIIDAFASGDNVGALQVTTTHTTTGTQITLGSTLSYNT